MNSNMTDQNNYHSEFLFSAPNDEDNVKDEFVFTSVMEIQGKVWYKTRKKVLWFTFVWFDVIAHTWRFGKPTKDGTTPTKKNNKIDCKDKCKDKLLWNLEQYEFEKKIHLTVWF